MAAPPSPSRRRPLSHRLSDENSLDRVQFPSPSVPAPAPARPTASPRPRRSIRASPTPSISSATSSQPPQDSPVFPLAQWMTPAIVAAGLVVVHVVHSGDFGTVLKGRRQSDGHWVAIKVVRKASLSEREHAALRKQAITLRVIRHRYIVQFFDDFEDDAFFYHVFEFLHGGDLYDRLETRGRPFSEPQVLFLARQLFYAVSYLHSRRAAHRDIKLENFVFETLPSDRRQVMKLIDFDLLVVRSASAPPVELCNNIGGTILYLSPEIASAREHVPEQSDMWACGVMLFVLLSYHMPFQGSTGRQILRAVQSTEPHFTPSIWASVSTETRQLIRDLLSKNGANRPTATQALERVKAIQALSRESQPSSKLRVLTRSLRSVSLNLWDPSGRMLRRSRNAPPNVRKGDDKDASGTTRRSQSNFPGEEPVSVNSLRSSFVLHHGAGSEAGSAPVVTDTRSDQFFGRNSALALTNFKDPRDPRPQPSVTNSEFQTPVTLSGLLARKRAGQQHRNKNDLPQIQASGSPSRSSRRLKKQSGFAMRLRNWISLSGSDSGR